MPGRAGRTAEATTRAEQAADAIARAFPAGTEAEVEIQHWLHANALAAVPDPGDGRTVAKLLNDGERAEAENEVLRSLVARLAANKADLRAPDYPASLDNDDMAYASGPEGNEVWMPLAEVAPAEAAILADIRERRDV